MGSVTRTVGSCSSSFFLRSGEALDGSAGGVAAPGIGVGVVVGDGGFSPSRCRMRPLMASICASMARSPSLSSSDRLPEAMLSALPRAIKASTFSSAEDCVVLVKECLTEI